MQARLLGAISCCLAPELLVPRRYPLQGPVAIGCLEQEKALTSLAIGAATGGCRARWPVLPGSSRDSVDGTVSSAARCWLPVLVPELVPVPGHGCRTRGARSREKKTGRTAAEADRYPACASLGAWAAACGANRYLGGTCVWPQVFASGNSPQRACTACRACSASGCHHPPRWQQL